MAIEFSCPQCSAVIRVPDVASGKKGSCPTCQTKLIVPEINIPDSNSQVSQAAPETQAPHSSTLEALQPTEFGFPQPMPEIHPPGVLPGGLDPVGQNAPCQQAPPPPQAHPESGKPESTPFDPFAPPPTTPNALTPQQPQTNPTQPSNPVGSDDVPPAPAWMQPAQPLAQQSGPSTPTNGSPAPQLTGQPTTASGIPNQLEQPFGSALKASEVHPAVDSNGGSPPQAMDMSAQPGVASRTTSMASRVRRRTKKKKSGLIFGVVCGIGLTIAVAYLYINQAPTLEGNRKAVMLRGGKLMPKTLSKDMIKADASAIEVVLNDFAEDVRRLRSQLVTAEFRGNLDGLEVTILTGTESRFVRFNIDKDLRKYYDQNLQKLDKARAKVLRTASKEFFEKWDVAIRNSEAVEDFPQYRDSVGLNCCRGGLGFHLSAQVGKGLYPCVYEDEANLYFAVPPSTKQMTIVGRFADTGEKSLFPGQYKVRVTQEKAPTQKSVEQPDDVPDDSSNSSDDMKGENSNDATKDRNPENMSPERMQSEK